METVRVLGELLALAINGEVTGIAVACSGKNMRYVTDIAGICYENPTFARGMVALLSDELAELAHIRHHDETR